MKVLISGVGGPTPRSIARSIKVSKFSNCELIGTDKNPLSHGLYQTELYSKTVVIPSASDDSYWDTIFNLVEKEQIDFAMVHPEQEVVEWSKRVYEGKPLPCKALLPEYPLVEVLLSKSKMTDLLENTGWVPGSYSFQRDELDKEALFSAVSFPFWVRASSGSSGLGSLLVKSEVELDNWIEINPKVEEFIASTYLPGRNLACKMLYHEGELVRAACGQRVNYIMAKVAPSGITGNSSYGRLLNEPELTEKAIQIMDRLFEVTQTKKHGFFTVDFKEDEHGNAYVTEINVRMVAFNYAFALAGANFSEDILSLLADDAQFDKGYREYSFEPGTIYLRDVDASMIVLLESELKTLN
jgi:carbamoylphosphate synthase large subunit